MEEKRERVAKVTCPFCGYRMQISYEEEAECRGVFVRCKGRNCRRLFEIRIKEGKQDW